MNILVVADNPSSSRGGQELSLFDVCSGLARKGHGITLVYDHPGNLLPKYREVGVDVVRIKHSACGGSFSIERKDRFRSVYGFAKFMYAGLRHLPDIIYINQPFDAFFTGAFARISGRPLICHLRLPPTEFCGQWRLSLPWVSQFIAISNATREEYIAAGFPANRITVVYNAVNPCDFERSPDPTRFRDTHGISRNAFVIGYAGRIDPGKGVDVLFEGFAKSGLWKQGAVLALAGKPLCHATPAAADAFLNELKSNAAGLGIAEHVSWLGQISEMAGFYSACDLIVLPSHNFSEGFGRVLIEAMSCATPAIGSDIGGIPEVLSGEFSRFLFKAGDPMELGKLLLATKALRQTCPELGTRCREHVLRLFPLTATVDGVESVLFKSMMEETEVHRWQPKPSSRASKTV